MRNAVQGQTISASVERTCPGCPFYLTLDEVGYCLGEKRIGDLADLGRSFFCRRGNGSQPLVRVRGSALPH